MNIHQKSVLRRHFRYMALDFRAGGVYAKEADTWYLLMGNQEARANANMLLNSARIRQQLLELLGS